MKHVRAGAQQRDEPEIQWDLGWVTDGPTSEPIRLRGARLGMVCAAGLAAALLAGLALDATASLQTPAAPGAVSPTVGVESSPTQVTTHFVPPTRPGPGQVAIRLVMSEAIGSGGAVCHQFMGDLGPSDGRMATALWRSSDGDLRVFAAGDRQSLCCLVGDRVKWISLTAEDEKGEPLAESRFTLTC